MGANGFATALREVRRRRRLSQLELAVRSGTTQRHVSFIESGRSAPGRAMVVRLAESLDVPLRERNELLLAAGFAPAYPERPLGDPGLRPVLSALEQVLAGHLPYPAVVVDRAGDLVLANAAFRIVTEGADRRLLEAPANVARLLLHPDGVAPRILNLDRWGQHIVDACRGEAARNPDPRLHALVAELEDLVPDRPQPGPDHVGFAAPLRLRSSLGELHLVTTISHFGTALDVTVAELRTEAFLPADEQTAARLARWADVPAGEARPADTPASSLSGRFGTVR